MKLLVRLTALFVLVLIQNISLAQVGIGTAIPDASSQLEISSTSKGLLIPRMTSAQRTAITSPATALLVFDTDTNSFWYYAGGWMQLPKTAWSLTGNAGTVDGTNFIGTTDNVPLNFRVNNLQSGRIDPTLLSVFFGQLAGSNNNAIANSALGHNALADNTTGTANTAMGALALMDNTSGSRNTAFGRSALIFNVNGGNNTAVGSQSLFNNITGGDNTGIGVEALNANVDGVQNTAVGAYALNNNFGNNNTATGFESLYGNQYGNYNTANGYQALRSTSTGSNNTAMGYAALQLNTTGQHNTAIGVRALSTNATGSLNTAIGYQANVGSNNLSNATAIGANASVTASNSLVLGGTGVNAVNVGIGTAAPVSTLHVKGIEKVFNGTDVHTGNFYNGSSSADGIELVSTNTTNAYIGVQSTSTFGMHISKANISSNNGLAAFFVNGVNVGTITTNGTTTSYNTTSDFRLKENIRSTQQGLLTLMKIKVEDYNYKADNMKATQTGFLAQQLYDLYPQAVLVGGQNAALNPWMIDYSKLTPLIVKSVQEQQELIDAQNKKIDSLEQKVEELSKNIEKLTKLVNVLNK